MSLATLKKKTAAKYKNMSVGQANFSLNGTHRSQGYVGQNLMSESCMLCTNDTNVIKPTVVGSGNHIRNKQVQGTNVVKPDSNHIQNSQHTYIEQVKKAAVVDCPASSPSPHTVAVCVNIIGAGNRPIFDKKPKSCYTIQKDLSGESNSSSSHTFNIASGCADAPVVVHNTGKTPLPGA